jgi:hypothetical protein
MNKHSSLEWRGDLYDLVNTAYGSIAAEWVRIQRFYGAHGVVTVGFVVRLSCYRLTLVRYLLNRRRQFPCRYFPLRQLIVVI